MLQPILGQASDQPSKTTTEYQILQGGTETVWSSTLRNQVISVSGTIKNLWVTVGNYPDTGNSYTFTVMVNGVASALTCVIADKNYSATDFINEVALNVGDTICLRCTPSGTIDAFSRTFIWSLDYNTEDKKSIVSCSNNIAGDTTLRYLCPMGDGFSTTENQSEAVIPITGTIKNLYAVCATAPGAGDSRIFIIRINEIDTNITCTISGTNITANDTTHTKSVVAGDIISISSSATGTPDASWVGVGFEFTSDNCDGVSILLGNHYSNFNGDFQFICGKTSTAGSGLVGQRSSSNYLLSKLYTQTSASPGGSTYFQTVVYGVSSITATNYEPNTTASDTVNNTLIGQDGSNYYYLRALDSSALNRYTAFGYVAYDTSIAYADIYDKIIINENISRSGIISPSISDKIVFGDTFNIDGIDLYISTYDKIVISDSILRDGIISPLIYDKIVISDNLIREGIISPSIYDNIVVSESISGGLNPILVVIYDDIVMSDFVNISPKFVILADISDIIAINDNATEFIYTGIDIGLRYYNGSNILIIPCQNVSSGKLRVYKNGTIYEIKSVDTGSGVASKIRFFDGVDIKSISLA